MQLKSLVFAGTLAVGFLLFYLTIEKIGFGYAAKTLSMITYEELAVLIVLNFVGIFVSIIRWRLIMRSLGVHISLVQITMAKLIGFSITYLLPGLLYGGEPFKIFFLKAEAKIPARKSIAPLIINETIFLAASLVVIIAGLFLLFQEVSLPGQVTLILLLALVILLVVAYFFYRQAIGTEAGEKGFFSRLLEMFRLDKIKAVARAKGGVLEIENDIRIFFREHKYVLLISVVLSFVENFLYLGTYWLTVLYLGYHYGYSISLPILSITYLNYLIPIPGSLGSFEMSQSYMFGVVGLGENTGLAFSLITRIVNLVVVVAGLAILGYFEIKVFWPKIKHMAARINKSGKDI